MKSLLIVLALLVPTSAALANHHYRPPAPPAHPPPTQHRPPVINRPPIQPQQQILQQRQLQRGVADQMRAASGSQVALTAIDDKVGDWGDFATLSEAELAALFKEMGIGDAQFDRNSIKNMMLAEMAGSGAPPEVLQQLSANLDSMLGLLQTTIGTSMANFPTDMAREFKQIYAANCCGKAQFIAALGAAETKLANAFRNEFASGMAGLAAQGGTPSAQVAAMRGALSGGTTVITYDAGDAAVIAASNMVGNGRGGPTSVASNTNPGGSSNPGGGSNRAPTLPGSTTSVSPTPSPANPTQPVNPTPTNPAQPVNPTPTNPVQVVNPTPTNPVQPVNPTPANPTPQVKLAPVIPTQPVNPTPANPTPGAPNPALPTNSVPGTPATPPADNLLTLTPPPSPLPDANRVDPITGVSVPSSPNSNESGGAPSSAARPQSGSGGGGRSISDQIRGALRDGLTTFANWLHESGVLPPENVRQQGPTLYHGIGNGVFEGRYGVKMVPTRVGEGGIVFGTNIGGGLVN